MEISKDKVAVMIGGTNTNIQLYISNQQTSHSRKLVEITSIQINGDYRYSEEYYCNRYKSQHIRGKWYMLTSKDIKNLEQESTGTVLTDYEIDIFTKEILPKTPSSTEKYINESFNKLKSDIKNLLEENQRLKKTLSEIENPPKAQSSSDSWSDLFK